MAKRIPESVLARLTKSEHQTINLTAQEAAEMEAGSAGSHDGGTAIVTQLVRNHRPGQSLYVATINLSPHVKPE